MIKSILNGQLDEQDDELRVIADKKSFDLVEFDFYINDRVVTTSLQKFIESNQDVKTESVIEIEYVERYPPPEPIDTNVTEDWISSIRGLDD